MAARDLCRGVGHIVQRAVRIDGRLLAEIANIGNKQAADAEGASVWISYEVTKGRLDVPSAIRAWRNSVGLP